MSNVNVDLLREFYAQASEHPLATVITASYDQQEYDQYMIELRRIIRFFYSLEEGGKYE